MSGARGRTSPRLGLLLVGLGLHALAASARPGPVLPVYLEDSHAGSFYWFAENLDWSRDYTLVLFDAHSDATQVFDSDVVRQLLARTRDRSSLLAGWRENGTIQCFDWIEPLMPRPFSRVVWVIPDHRDVADCREEVRREINAHEAVAPRAGGSLADRFEVVTRAGLPNLRFQQPVVVSLDLDFFAADPAENLADRFDETWKGMLALPGLEAVTASISTPYLKSRAQAETLVELFLDRSLKVANARVRYEPFAATGPDRSRAAKERIRRGEAIPAFTLDELSPSLAALVSASRDRIEVRTEIPRWKEHLEGWAHPRISVFARRADHDGAVRVRRGSGFEIRCDPAENVTWSLREHVHRSHNLLGVGVPFAGDAPLWIRLHDCDFLEGRPWIDEEDLAGFLDPDTGTGALRLVARSGDRVSNELLVRIRKEDGFLGAIEESFVLPYVLGGGDLREGSRSGPELGHGADCANFAIHALRRWHRHLPWMDPLRLRSHTETVARFEPGDLSRGLFADFGNHLAVLVEDREPIGRFNDTDLFANQLEGRPERIELGALRKDRKAPEFRRLARPENEISLVFGGDVMLARGIGRAFEERGADPFEGIRDSLTGADLAIVNLECALALPDPEAKPDSDRGPFVFRAPLPMVGLLAKTGVDLVSLANNHSLDAGPEGLTLTEELLEEEGISPFGGSSPFAVRSVGPLRIALVGMEPGDSSEPVREASSVSDFTIVFAHWGLENRVGITETQEKLAEEWARLGADLIVGAGPHCIQKVDRIGRVPVFYSLGNLVFDGGHSHPDWRQGALAEVVLSKEGEIFETRLIPVDLDLQGLPKIASDR